MQSIIKKINVLGLVALFAASGMALAFNVPQTLNADEVEWHQVKKSNGQLEWRNTPPNSDLECENSTDLCKATLPIGFIPTGHTKDEIIAEASEYELGFVEE